MRTKPILYDDGRLAHPIGIAAGVARRIDQLPVGGLVGSRNSSTECRSVRRLKRRARGRVWRRLSDILQKLARLCASLSAPFGCLQ